MNIFAYLRNENESAVIKRIPLDRNLQAELTTMFRELINEYVPDSDDLIINFEDNVDYKPEDNEVLLINNFDIQDSLINCARNPLVVDILGEEDYEYIKNI